MKIISLNTWGGIAGTEGLLEFFKTHSDTDIFCLQEVFNGGADDEYEKLQKKENKEYELFNLIQKALPNHTGFFYPHFKDFYGLAMFIKNGVQVLEEGEHFVHKHKGFIPTENIGFHGRNIQYIKTIIEGKELYVINFHGLWNGQGKSDTEDRLEQSRNIINFTNALSADYVLCGDFNLLPDTKSLMMIEESGLRNLVGEYGITSTRTSHYTKPIRLADYAFVTGGLAVKDFKVLPDEVSDHSPLYLEIE